jgi:hypothetical protein
MTLIWMLGAFLLFIAAMWSVHMVDDYAMAHYGYAPFAIPNVLFTLVLHGLLLFVIRDGGEQTRLLVTLTGAATLGMFLLVRSRTSGWIALFTVPILLFCAPLLVFSVFFRHLSRIDSGKGE